MEASSCKLDAAAEDMKSTMYLKERQEHSSADGAQSSASARHGLPPSSVATPSSTADNYLEQIKVGSFYEIDHSKLPSATPEQLKAIRIVMVSEKDEVNVSLRYPSVYSLRAHFRSSENPNEKKLPGLNEKYMMSSNIAGEVLYRRIPSSELADRKNSWDFWTAPTEDIVSGGEANNAASKKGVCWSQLKFTGMVQWGSRRQVQYIGRHEDKKLVPLSKSIEHEEEKKESLGEEERKADQDQDGEELFKVTNTDGEQNSLKRKRHCSRNVQKKPKNAILERKNGAQLRTICRRKELKKSIDRWSVERYKLAEENMLKIMKAKGAVFGNPILRPALRAEARKLIGDTGLLDHLLKHMAGKVAPGGADRFRRRHNADGAMEYWLESADLINIRREAGVQDPYWTPPPGWKLGDNPTQDPICAREIRELHYEIAQIKKYMLEQASMRQQDLAIVTTQPKSDITSLDHEKGSSFGLKEIYNELLNRKAKIEEQLVEISESLRGIEEQTMILHSKVVEDQKMSELEAPPSPLILPHDTERDQIKKGIEKMQEGHYNAMAEDKAARIQRLKSGFRICKPQGTFLWPNMVPDVVPTPPSASSTTTAPRLSPGGPHPSSPLKPLPRRPVSSTATAAATTPTLSKVVDVPRRPANLINLNEVPHCDHSYCGTLTYQRRNPTACPDLPRLVCGKEENEVERKECSVSSSSVPSWLSMGDGWWLDHLGTTSKSSVPAAPECD